jgi:hypothetical protein
MYGIYMNYLKLFVTDFFLLVFTFSCNHPTSNLLEIDPDPGK